MEAIVENDERLAIYRKRLNAYTHRVMAGMDPGLAAIWLMSFRFLQGAKRSMYQFTLATLRLKWRADEIDQQLREIHANPQKR